MSYRGALERQDRDSSDELMRDAEAMAQMQLGPETGHVMVSQAPNAIVWLIIIQRPRRV